MAGGGDGDGAAVGRPARPRVVVGTGGDRPGLGAAVGESDVHVAAAVDGPPLVVEGDGEVGDAAGRAVAVEGARGDLRHP